MSIYNVINAGLYSKLQGGTALTSLLSGTTAIYYQEAPAGASLPYVVFDHQGGGPDNINPSDMRNQIVYVRGYASTPALAGSVDAHCSTLLHRGSVTVSGYTTFYCVRETDLSLVETTPAGERIYSAGALYRVRLTA